jgi:CO dehydrogenase/acetyl-CoA synthase alpha subunit
MLSALSVVDVNLTQEEEVKFAPTVRTSKGMSWDTISTIATRLEFVECQLMKTSHLMQSSASGEASRLQLRDIDISKTAVTKN